MSVKVCLHLRSVYTYLVRLRLRVCTHSARQIVRLHSHNVNLTDTETETETDMVSVCRPLFTIAVAKPKSVLRSPLVLNTLTEVQEILAAFKGPFAR